MSRRQAAALLAMVFVLAACGPSPSPSPSASASVVVPSGSAAAASSPAGASASSPAGAVAESQAPSPVASPTPRPSVPAFALTSATFDNGGVIPARYTCDGRDVSPALAWAGAPAGTTSLLLIVDDLDARNFTHWIAYAIPPATTRLDEGAGAASSKLAQGTNDFGRVGWGGPCPPSGTHRYVFTLYALAAPLSLSGTPDASTVRAALAKASVVGKASLTARYARGG